MNFGKRLKELRNNAHLTQKQLGDMIGLSKTVISYYELGSRAPSPEVLIKLAKILHVTTDYLLGIEEKGDPTVNVSGLTDEEINAIERLIHLMRNDR